MQLQTELERTGLIYAVASSTLVFTPLLAAVGVGLGATIASLIHE